jgi:hypothetical protein
MIARLDNTSRSALIRGGIFAVALCAAVLFVSTVALAADGWFNPTKLYSLRYDSPDQPTLCWMELIPSWHPHPVLDGFFVYEYQLDYTLYEYVPDDEGHPTGAVREVVPPDTDWICSFALTFSDVQGSFTEFQPLTGWGYPDGNGVWQNGTPFIFPVNDGKGTELIWNAFPGLYGPGPDYPVLEAPGGLAYGESVTFGFTTTLDPDQTQDNKTCGTAVRAYNGFTYGPGPRYTGDPAPVPELPSVFLGLPGLAFVQVIRTRLAGRIRRRAR